MIIKRKIIAVLSIIILILVVTAGWLVIQKRNNAQNINETRTSLPRTRETTSTTAQISSEEKEENKGAYVKHQPDSSKWLVSDTEISFPILMYHSLDEQSDNSLKIPPNEFKQHMEWLKTNGYYTLTPEEAYLVLTENKKPAEKIVWVTFDDGYYNNYQFGFPILKELEMNATINYIQSKLNSTNYFNEHDMLEMIQSGWISIESHTINHYDLDSVSYDEQLTELSEAKKWFDNTLKQDTSLICYPAGRYNEDTLSAAKDAGYKMAVTTEPGWARASDGLYALKRVRISPGYDGQAFGEFVESYNY